MEALGFEFMCSPDRLRFRVRQPSGRSLRADEHAALQRHRAEVFAIVRERHWLARLSEPDRAAVVEFKEFLASAGILNALVDVRPDGQLGLSEVAEFVVTVS